jgi:hypothetical protein
VQKDEDGKARETPLAEALEDTLDVALREAQRLGRVAVRLDPEGRKVYYLVLS